MPANNPSRRLFKGLTSVRSHPGNRPGVISTTVTFDPSAAYTEPISRPIYPPPTTNSRGGTSFSSSAPVESITRGQWEAAESLAMNRLETLRHVVLPQALRIAVAPTVGFSVQVVKGTAVTSIIGFTELTKTGSMLANATFEPFMVYGFVALGYFLLCYPLSLAAYRLERRLNVTA